MDEGVDPTHMCQSLVHKVAQSKQLMAVTDPDILVLFEDWLEELEEEAINCINKRGWVDAGHIAQDLGLSERGASFLPTKLKRESKI